MGTGALSERECNGGDHGHQQQHASHFESEQVVGEQVLTDSGGVAIALRMSSRYRD